MSASEMELASILYVIESNCQFFLSKRFTILTDHVSHCYVRNLKFQHGKLYRWALRLQNYNFCIQHIKGTLTPADYLSREVHWQDSTANDLEDDSVLVHATDNACTATDIPVLTDSCSGKHASTSHNTVNKPVIAPAPLMRHPRRQSCYNSVALRHQQSYSKVFRATT